MAVKTITIDLEAYDILARRKRTGESFSQLIKREFGGRPTASAFRSILDRLRPDPTALEAVEAQVRARRRSPARAAGR